MSSYEPPTGGTNGSGAEGSSVPGVPDRTEKPGSRVGTVVWGLTIVALAALIIVAKLGVVALNGTYVLIGVMIGAGAALVVGGILSSRARDKNAATRKS